MQLDKLISSLYLSLLHPINIKTLTMAIDKIILSNRSALTEKYGNTGIKKIEAAISKLIKADKKRKINGQLIYMDDAKMMKRYKSRVVKSALDERENKNAVDDLYNYFSPDYIMLLGGINIIPHQIFPDFADDERIPSDLPYCCNHPYSEFPKDFLAPVRVVGRLPDITNVSDLNYFLGLINNSTEAISRKAAEYNDYFALSVNCWKGSTRQSLMNMFGNADALQLCPPEGTPFKKQEFKPRVHFYNCHGDEDSVAFYGQLRSNSPTPECIYSHELKGNIRNGTIIAAECCFGAQLLDPSDADPQQPGMANTYLGEGAYAFVGSSTSAYGPPNGQGLADLITQFFVKGVQRGASAGRSFVEAQQKFIVQCGSYFDRFELKTLCQFMLLADPSINPVIDEELIKANSKSKSVIDSNSTEVVARKERREMIKAKGEAQAALTNTPQRTKVKLSASLQREINKLLKENNFEAAKGITDGFGKTKGLKGTKSAGASKKVRYHIYTKHADKPIFRKTSPDTVLVLKEINGKITELREYARKG